MRRIRMLGVSLLAAFSLGAPVVSSAQAGQLGKCAKAAKVEREIGGRIKKVYAGRYTDKRCSTRATSAEEEKGKNNKYEWEPNAKVIPFTSEDGRVSFSSWSGEIACRYGSGVGELANATENTETATFDECVAEPNSAIIPCQSGATKGMIVTNTLTGKLIDHGETVVAVNEKGEVSEKEPAAGEVWVNYTGTEGKPLFEFNCVVITFKVSGDLAGVIPSRYLQTTLKKGRAGKEKGAKRKPGKPTFTEEFRAGHGAQGLVFTICGEPVKEKTGKECVEKPAVQEEIDEVAITALEKSLEIDDI
jgi:hypothetical protein